MVVTNALGVAFTAALLSASDAGVTFVFPEDGATNELVWTQLSAVSQDAVCAATDFAPMPPEMAATYRLAVRELQKLAVLEAEQRIEPAEATQRRKAIRESFAKRCERQGVPNQRMSLLLKRLDYRR